MLHGGPEVYPVQGEPLSGTINSEISVVWGGGGVVT